jgi:saccharopine dehydrogenase (NAD+, L-lysine-forming)
MTTRVWLRHELRRTECRAPVTPDDARRLVEGGFEVTVEESPQRVFRLDRYAEAGCRTTGAGGWPHAPDDAYVLGLKELPDEPSALRHRHVYFGHAYKGQPGAGRLLRRFQAGGGALLDLEWLVDGAGRRLAAFGYWAGYAGAALAILAARRRLGVPLLPVPKEELDAVLIASRGSSSPGGDDVSVVIIGALGRCGRGARDALAIAGITPTCWDIPETRNLDRRMLLRHDLLVNAVLTTNPEPPLLTAADLDDPARRLRLICDVTCDVDSPYNLLPIYDVVTDWRQPVRRLRDGAAPLDLIAIDNLPSLLPEESSVDFSAQLLPHLLTLGTAAATWQRSLRQFTEALRLIDLDPELTDV